MQVQNFFTPLVHSQSKEAVGVNTRKAQYPPPPRISWLLEKHFLPNFINLTPITLHFALVPCEVSKTLLLVGWSRNQTYLNVTFHEQQEFVFKHLWLRHSYWKTYSDTAAEARVAKDSDGKSYTRSCCSWKIIPKGLTRWPLYQICINF